MTTFQKVKIKDHCDIISSKRIFADEYLLSGVPFYRGKEISEKQRSSSEVSGLIYISRAKFNEIKSKYGVPQKGDLLLTSVGTIGNPYLIKKDEEFYFKDGNLTWFRNFQGIDGQWLYYWLLSPQGKSELNKCTIGSSQKAYTINLLYNLQIELPDLPIQTRIASVLSAYDDLIENNEKRIKALEEMAQSLYTEWFVKFKFTSHENAKMVESSNGYGPIPEGWGVAKLEEVASIVRGCSYSSEEIDDFIGDYYIVNLKSFNRGGGFRFDGAKYYSGTPNKGQLLKTGDIVVAVTDMTTDRAVIARPARVPEIDGKVTFSADVVKVNSDTLPNTFIYELLSSYRFTEITKQKANGANVLHLKPTAILEFTAIIPSGEIIEKFDRLCEPVAREVDKLLKQNDNLSKTRDLLIPQLVTGKRELK
jgi:type I restriction enzyme S subunit